MFPVVEVGPRRRAGVPWVVIDGDVVLVDAVSGEVHILGGAVAAVWQLLDGGPLSGLARLVADEFGLGEDAVAVDLDRSLSALADIGVVDGL